MVGRTARTFGIVALYRTLLTAFPNHDRRIEVQRIIVKGQLREEPTVEFTKDALVRGLGEFVEVSLVCPVVGTTLPAKEFAQSGIIPDHIKMAEAIRTTPNTGKQTMDKLNRIVPTVRPLDRHPAVGQLLLKTTTLQHLQE